MLRHAPLRKGLWIPKSTSRAFRLTYVTKDSHERRATSTGTVFVPHGRPPKGGWPVVSWAHGISGLGDSCAPSKVGPVLKQRDWSYLRTWMRQGYAVVATDYVGLGTPGLMPYLDGKAQAHSVVDMVKAGRAFTRTQEVPTPALAQVGHDRSVPGWWRLDLHRPLRHDVRRPGAELPRRRSAPAPRPTSRTTSSSSARRTRR